MASLAALGLLRMKEKNLGSRLSWPMLLLCIRNFLITCNVGVCSLFCYDSNPGTLVETSVLCDRKRNIAPHRRSLACSKEGGLLTKHSGTCFPPREQRVMFLWHYLVILIMAHFAIGALPAS